MDVKIKMALISVIYTLVLFISGCVQLCRPVYHPSQYLTFQNLSDIPVKLKLVDGRKDNEKKFLKVSFANYWDKSSTKYNQHQRIQLDRYSVEIIESSIKEAMDRCGYRFSEDANVILVVELRKFFCDDSVISRIFADIELDFSIQKNEGVVFRKYFNEHSEKPFDGFQQYQDAELLLGRSLSTAVEKIASNKEVLNVIQAAYGKSVAREEPSNSATPKAVAEKSIISQGTGFVVSPEGHIITAYHIVKDANQIRIKLEGGDWLSASLQKYSILNDVAVISINQATPNFLPFADSSKIQQGQNVFTMGYPVVALLGDEPKYTEGIISSLSGIMNEDSLMQISVPVQPGNSGGPLVNTSGEIVGMITSSAAIQTFLQRSGTLPQNVNWAVKGNYITPLLPNNCADKSQTNTKTLTGKPVDIVKKSVCLIEARKTP